MIDRQIVNKVLAATHIEDVIGGFIPLKKSGANYIGICPFHKGKYKSFTVSPEKGIYKCFACGKGGKAISFLMEYKHFSYPESIQWLAEKYGIAINTDSESDNNQDSRIETESFSKVRIAFIDTEVGVDNKKVMDYGAVREDGAVMHTQSTQEFNAFVSECDFLCGHNIIKHDLKYLNLQRKHVIIDTLPLSPLLFPKRPYHHLVKDDKLQVDELNNPVNDSMKARDLLNDELAAWNHISDNRRIIYYYLLNETQEFGGFFKYVDYSPNVSWISSTFASKPDWRQLILKEYDGKVCSHADFETLVKQYPIELAYCLAVIGADDIFSITPAWVIRNYPQVVNVMNLLCNTSCGDCEYCH